MILARWVSAVLTERSSKIATSFVLRPSARSWVISRWRTVRRLTGDSSARVRERLLKPLKTISATLAVKKVLSLCTALHGFARLCTALHGFARLCTALHGFARLCTALHGFARL